MYLMMTLFYLFILFLYFVKKKENMSLCSIFFIGFILILIATFRNPELPDYYTYLSFKLASLSEEYYERFEPSMFFIRSFSDWITSSHYMFFFIYALLAVIIKLYALNRLTNLFFLSLLCYVAMDFPIHEMIQMRAAVSMGIALWAFIFIYKRQLGAYIATTLLAVSFHYSAMLIFPLYFLNPYSINKKLQIILLAVSFLIGIVGIGCTYWIQFISFDFVQKLFHAYQYQTLIEDEAFSIFSITVVVLTAVQLFLLLHADRLQLYNRYIYLLLKVQNLSIISFFLFNDMPIVGGRISEYYRIAFIVSVPLIIYICNNRIVARLIVVALCCMFYFRFFTLYYL